MKKSLRNILAGLPDARPRAVFDQGPVWADWADAGRVPTGRPAPMPAVEQ